jgi:outer membrane protein assembly factor BamB
MVHPMLPRRAGLSLVLLLAACDGVSSGAGGVVTVRAAATLDDMDGMMSADAARTGFYPNQPALDPAIVGSPYFGQLFDAPLDGQIYAQPLYAGGVVFVATESNHLYGLDPTTGQVLWTRQLGTPFQATDINCGDLLPSIGVSGTPAIDAEAGVAYLLSKTYASGASGAATWSAHAIDLATGAEHNGFPVEIGGAANNEPTQVFNPTLQMQRPGLLLMDGVVYAAFGAHCDEQPYTGWVVGISTKGYVATMWTSEGGPGKPSGGGIWQAGGGLVSDGDGQILFATGNDWTVLAGPVPGHTPPVALGESLVRLSVQADGTLAATDFFSPADRDDLNRADADLGSGAPVALPASFGTAAHPRLLAHAGKMGYLYLIDRDDLGGYQQGANGSDQVLQKLGPNGGVWSRPSVWPGDGGYVYEPVVYGCGGPDDPSGCLLAYKMGATADGTPVLSSVASSSSSFAYGSSAAVVTSDGTRSGSALLWTVWSSGWTGTGSELRAYDALPRDGTLTLRYLAAIGTSAKFTAPAVGDGKLYVGTRDGHVIGFGVTGAPTLRASGAAFAPTVVGGTTASAVQVTVTGAVSITGFVVSGDFALDDGAPAVPFTAAAGTSFSLPVVFRPTTEGAIVGTLQIETDGGTFSIPLTGVGQSRAPLLGVSPTVMTFAPIVLGNTAIQTVTITNESDASLAITAVTPPAPPFSMSDLPGVGAVLDPGASWVTTLTYAPTSVGSSSGYLSIAAGDAVAAIAVEGAALTGGKLRISPATIDAGSSYVGDVSTTVFQLTNDGDVALVIEKSKPPTSATFVAQDPFGEGTILAPGASIEQLIRVSPAAEGANADVWQLNANDGLGLRQLTMTVLGLARPVTPAASTTPTVTSSEPAATATAASLTSAPPVSTAEPRAAGCSVGSAAPATRRPLVLVLAALVAARRRRRAR